MADCQECTLEVLDVPEDIDEDILNLYFENQRRSGGGSLVSLEKRGSQAFVVFADPETALRVISKSHILCGKTLTLRRKPPEDSRKLLLRGLHPETPMDYVELYLENITRMASETDFKLDEVSKKHLNGVKVTLERVECTDSILVSNITPALTEDVLELYFGSSRSGGADVVSVSMLGDGCAKVSFKDVKSVDSVLQKSHTFQNTDLVVEPYFHFLHALVDQASSGAHNGQGLLSDGNQTQPQIPDVSQPSVDSLLNQVSPSTNTSTVAAPEPTIPEQSHVFVSVTDASRYQLISLSKITEDLKKAHPKFDIILAGDGVQIKGPDQIEAERLKNKVLEFLTGIVQDHMTNDPLRVEFLERDDVKKRLELSLKMLPSIYGVSNGTVIVTSSSRIAAKQAHDLIESQISQFTLPMVSEYESMVLSEEWENFRMSLDFCSVKVSDTVITVVTLSEMEKDIQAKIVEFLNTPRQKETILSMESGKLKFLHLHHQDLLADMGEIQGEPGVCQLAAEILTDVIGSVLTRKIVVKNPGICRFLMDEEGSSLLAEMTAKFQVYIDMTKVHWEPLEDKDILELAWNMMPCQNFQRSSRQGVSGGLPNGSTSAHIEEAKKMLAVLGSDFNPQHSTLESTNIDPVDLYSSLGHQSESEDEDNQPQVLQVPDPQTSSLPAITYSLDEDASLLLAIQMSMETNQKTDTEDIQMALELSKSMSIPNENTLLEKGVEMSLEESIKSCNTAEIVVYANYSHDLARVDIALGKKVGLRRHEEKVENRNLRKLSVYQKRCIKLIERKHAVEIIIQGTTATLNGFKDYVSAAILDLENILRRTEHIMSDSEILKSIEWVWFEPGSTTSIAYPPEATVFIENAWKLRQKKIDILLNNQPCTVDFQKMEEHCSGAGKSVAIKRMMMNTEDLYTADTDEDYSLLSCMPEVSAVNTDSEEFNNVVEKLNNKLLWNQYRLKKVSIEQSSTEPQVERILYHGTSETSVKEICIHGFNRSFCGKNATVYGQGVYFAVNACLSVLDTYSPPNADGYKYIFVAKVLTGDFTVGRHEIRAAPLKENSSIPVRYHSVTDQISSPSLFVIFNDTQAYPEYLITCKKTYKH
ncbi:hypothetical protein DNTS_012419 [Danionella cerebrum]|uniref:Poly [ADP-ribose] polymerase n=1 Tax=Danionella cerebrum TaxID=2873325 RepID=A0A553RIT4_9TELE|nr:hypothetical protein DNTS_012419 [Danionella translucida]